MANMKKFIERGVEWIAEPDGSYHGNIGTVWMCLIPTDGGYIWTSNIDDGNRDFFQSTPQKAAQKVFDKCYKFLSKNIKTFEKAVQQK